jgi:hypothetical protein
VGELELPVDPALGLLRQLLRRQLAGGQHDLAQLAVDHVAVGVDGQEVVVEAEELDLVVALEQRALVPQPDVLERALVLGHRLRVDRAPGRMAPGLDPVEPERLARVLDVVGQELPLPGQLARLDRSRWTAVGRDGPADEERGERTRRPPATSSRLPR